MSTRPSTLDRHDVQGLVARGYGDLPCASYALLAIRDADGARDWLRALLASEHLATIAKLHPHVRVNVAFTAQGLSALRFGAELPQGFSREFNEGMATKHRARMLGDEGNNDQARWRWGGQGQAVHVLLMTFAREETEVDAATARLLGRAESLEDVVPPVRARRLSASKEHFGFRDGMGQPSVRGLSRLGHPDNTIALGEILLGHENEYGRLPTSPKLGASSDDPKGVLPVGEDGLPDLGHDGSYLVARQLSQDVPGFWQFLRAAAAREGGDPVRLGAKMVGRWPSGAPIALAHDRDDPSLATMNTFGYAHADPRGDRCPIGAHTRRSNPRDSATEDREESIKLVKRHRILRRGRPYGPPVDEQFRPELMGEPPQDDVERGLFFACLNANIGRQFEFIQQTWVNSAKFNGLYADTDPIVGQRTQELPPTFTQPGVPVRARATGVPEFVSMRGGAYFFLPSIRAIRFLVS